MSAYNPPQEDLPIFDSDLFNAVNEGTLTILEADARYLRFPQAQGQESLQAINVNGAASFLSSVSFTNNPTCGALPLPLANDSSTIIPTTAWVQTAISGGGGGGATSVLYTAGATISFATAGRRDFMVVGAGGASSGSASGGGGGAFMLSLYVPAPSSIIIAFTGGNTTLTWNSPALIYSTGSSLIGTANKGGNASTSVGVGGTAVVNSSWGGGLTCSGQGGSLLNLASGNNLMWSGSGYGRGGFTSPTTTAAGTGAVLITTYA